MHDGRLRIQQFVDQFKEQVIDPSQLRSTDEGAAFEVQPSGIGQRTVAQRDDACLHRVDRFIAMQGQGGVDHEL